MCLFVFFLFVFLVFFFFFFFFFVGGGLFLNFRSKNMQSSENETGKNAHRFYKIAGKSFSHGPEFPCRLDFPMYF